MRAGARVVFKAKVFSSAPVMLQSVTQRIQENYSVGTKYLLDCSDWGYTDVRRRLRPEEPYELTVALRPIQEGRMAATGVLVGFRFCVSPIGLPELAREWKAVLVALPSDGGSEHVFDTGKSDRFIEVQKEPSYRERIREMLQRWDNALERWKREV